MTRRTIRVDPGTMAHQRGEVRARDFLQTIRSGVPTSGAELFAVAFRVPDEEAQAFFRVIQAALENNKN